MTSRNFLAAIALNVENPVGLATFYCDNLGMQRLDWNGEVAVGYGGQGATLVLRSASSGPAYEHAPDHRYWKVAITMPNLDLAYAQLTQRGIAATDPHQFREIAYMSHLVDPEGHVLELIQHTFAGKPRVSEGDKNRPMGGGAQIGLITLRTDDIEAEKACFLDELGMSYLSRQAISDLGFDLYFFACTEETQPDPDVNAMVNREWLWQRPYTTLEFQHWIDDTKISQTEDDHLGAARVLIELSNKKGIRALS